MRTAIWMVRQESEALGLELATSLSAVIFRPWLENSKAQDLFRASYRSFSAWVFVGTTGIAVRYLQGLLDDKQYDPCLVVVDEAGSFAVSLVGGHEGGGNELAYKVSSILLGAVPVVTTASDSLKPLVLGLGCRLGVTAETIAEAVKLALKERSLSEIREIATIELKAAEPGLIEFCKTNAIPMRIFKQQDIAARQWCTTTSAHVIKTVGLDCVCEPCALMASPRGKLILAKTTHKGVALAMVEDSRRITT